MRNHVLLYSFAVVILVAIVSGLGSKPIEAEPSVNAVASTAAVRISWNNTDSNNTLTSSAYVGPKTTSPRVVVEYGDFAARVNLTAGATNVTVLPRMIVEYSDTIYRLSLKPVQGPTVAARIKFEYADYASYIFPVSRYPGPYPQQNATEVRFKLSPNPALVGQTVSLLGNLTTVYNVPIPNEQVTVKLNGTQIATLQTNSTGWFGASGQVMSAGTYNITIQYNGSGQYLPSSHSELLVVNKVKSWIYTIFIPNPVNSTKSCELRGVLLDQFSNPLKLASVNIAYSTDFGLTWHSAGTLTTNSYGVFSNAFIAPNPGTYLVRTSYAGSTSYETSSADVPLVVR